MTQRPLHLFLTGHPGVGKTTAITRIASTITAAATATTSHTKHASPINMRGFYTTELRDESNNTHRSGFDIVSYSPPHRCPLARLGKGKPSVGKYVVDVTNIDNIIVPSLRLPDGDESCLVIVDEIGKMELLSPEFYPAVVSLLDNVSARNNNNEVQRRRKVIIGTIPTPRYGRIIPAVEQIRSREDVFVVHLTKGNREEVTMALERVVMVLLGMRNEEGDGDVMVDDEGGTIYRRLLGEYEYQRPIGASSMNGGGKAAVTKTTAATTTSSPRRKKPKQQQIDSTPINNDTNDNNPSSCSDTNNVTNDSPALPLPCGPLVRTHIIPPRVLLVGELSSPRSDDDTSRPPYAERSFWRLLSSLASSNSNSTPSTRDDEKDATSQRLRHIVLDEWGMAIWDVLSNVHVGGLPRPRRREETANDLGKFLSRHPSIEGVLFNGQKARDTFGRHFRVGKMETNVVLGGRRVRMGVLPSSSRVNTRVSMEEKVEMWRVGLAEFCPVLK